MCLQTNWESLPSLSVVLFKCFEKCCFFSITFFNFLFRLLRAMKDGLFIWEYVLYFYTYAGTCSHEQLSWTESELINDLTEWKKFVIWIVQLLLAKTNLTIRTRSFIPLIFERDVIDSLTWNNNETKKKYENFI